MTTVADVVARLELRYPPVLAEPWDAVGLSVGDPAATVDHVLLAVDPTMDVIEEAVADGAQLLVTHHPLILRGVTSVAADTAKGQAVHRLITAGVALFSAHTNADAAAGGVAEALGAALGLANMRPLVPLAGDTDLGAGRVGSLAEPVTLRDFAEGVAAALPGTAQGVRVAGDLGAVVSTVAVLGGSGDSYLDAVRATGADVYVTADLRHHPASEARELARLHGGRPALVDVAHSASEAAWLAAAAADLESTLGITARVSNLTTDPWTARFASPGRD